MMRVLLSGLHRRPLILLALLPVSSLAQSLTPGMAVSCQEIHGRPKVKVTETAGIGQIEMNALGEADYGDKIKDAAQLIAQVAHELGLAVPPHQMNMVPSDQFNVMAISGGHPAPHWRHGYDIASAGSSRSGVLEFVTQGCPTCRAFYSASLPFTELLSIIMHVAGHLDMGITSDYMNIRPGDGPLAAYQLSEALRNAYGDHGHDEVSLFFQFLGSIDGLQDYYSGTFEAPEMLGADPNFPIKPPASRSFWESSKVTGSLLQNLIQHQPAKKKESFRGWGETASVMQALTNLLPPEAPDWQRSIFKLYEQSHRNFPGIFQTKIMNEGWATLMMYVLARHLPWVSSADLVKFAQLLSGVTYPNFSNPYWVGVSGWFNLYDQFMERPEIKRLAEKEKDKQFMAWARQKYANKNDSQFAVMALDQRWIEKQKFFLYRLTQNQEMDPNVEPEKQKFIALTRDWKRIQNFIRAKYVDNKLLYYPSVSLINPALTPGRLKFVQNKAQELPLEIHSAAKTLFVIAQLMRRPAQIDAYFSRLVNPSFGRSLQLKLENSLLEVSVTGEVSLVVDGRKDEDLSRALAESIKGFKDNVLASFSDEYIEQKAHEWGVLAAKVSDHQVEATGSEIVDFAPHAGPAVREYLYTVERRLFGAIRDSLTGTVRPRFKNGKVTLPVLPEIPRFQFDGVYYGYQMRGKPVGPVDQVAEHRDHDFHVDGNGSVIGSGPHLPGDRWGPRKKKNKGDKGDGDGDGQPGDDGDGHGRKPGDDGDDHPQPGTDGSGAGNPQDIQIPLKLYGELLGEVLELPNIRRTEGKNPETRRVRQSSVMKPMGNILWDQTMIVAIEKARALRKGKGLPSDSSVPLMDLIKEALPLIEPSDYRVSGRTEKPRPDFDAVLVVNLDLTGSMAGERIENAKNLVFNIEALLKAKYKNVELVFVGFDTTAKEMTREQAFSKFFGGGTNYLSAAELDHQILMGERFPSSRYNKYILTVGDAETMPHDAEAYVKKIEEMKDDLQYAGLAVTNEYLNGIADLVRAHHNLKAQWPWVGVGHLRTASDMMQVIKDIFAGEKE
ncbi:MAG: hypothetical protein C5B49_09865 [Bdellovibrio sp.]|nr:MAG: hypothetical protein C5B49_09865 [Bdellovibrio sp.]